MCRNARRVRRVGKVVGRVVVWNEMLVGRARVKAGRAALPQAVEGERQVYSTYGQILGVNVLYQQSRVG